MLSARLPIAEAQLAAAVIQRALEDALVPDDRLARPRVIQTADGPKRTFTPGLKPREREEAVRFLLDTAPGWVGSREAWCDAADLDPEVVRRHALKTIPHTSIPTDLHRALRLPAPVITALAALPVSVDALHATALNAAVAEAA